MTAVKDIELLGKYWHDFIDNGFINPDVQEPIGKSWYKCRSYGVDPEQGLGKLASKEVFRSIQETNQALIDVSLPIMESVFKIVESSHFLLVLTDSAGYLLETIGDKSIKGLAKDLRFEKGALWNELQVGTNAISVALDYDTPIQTIGPEHYCIQHHNWTCSAAPIHGINGEVVGCLNMSGSWESAHLHTLGLVEAAAFGIEQHLLSMYSEQMMRMALDNNPESILILDGRFHPVWVNNSARQSLDIETESISKIDFREVMPEIDWTQIEKSDKDAHFFTSNTPIIVGLNKEYCSVNITTTLSGVNERAFTVNITKQEQDIDSVNVLSGNHARYSFDNVYAADSTMKNAITTAQRFARYNGNVLIEGEIGTGKSMFAQAIHNASTRSEGPFVIVNCASMPRDMIESELYGYGRGFAEGALQDGFPGKFELANKGTIFLDEISEIPLEFQASLLQVVKTQKVRRIGAGYDTDLDVRIIASTTRSLRSLTESKLFRADLFFLVNVLSLNIPPLRERPADIVFCAQKFLNQMNQRNHGQKKTLDEECFEILESYSWPGNIRELHNCVERAYFATESSVLRVKDFADIIGCSCKGTTIANPFIFSTMAMQSRRDIEEYEEIMSALEHHDYRVEKAAVDLGISRASLYRHIKRFKISLGQLRHT